MKSNKCAFLLSLFFYLALISAGNDCLAAVYHHNSPVLTTNNDKTETWLTIFVHGIMSIQPHLTPHNIMRFLRDDVENTVYAKTVEYMRNNPYFYLNQAMQEFGLRKIDKNDIRPGNASSGIAQLYDEVTHMVAPATDNHYYTFGWSGLLSPKSRYSEAVKLFTALQKELQEKFWSKDIFPKVRLIGYSHGGNVCLNVAAAKNNVDPGSTVSIDELILMGVPIQTETDYLSADPIFKRIYHFFSRSDRIQRIDLFSFNRIFSRRCFQSNNHFKAPKKLMQIEVKITRKAKRRHAHTPEKQKLYIDYDNPGVVSGRSRLFRDTSPGHLEFWFFGWSPRHYRSAFPLHPLPALVILPYLIACLNSTDIKIKNPNPVIVDIRRDTGSLIIKQRKRNHLTEVFPFISQDQMNKLSQIAYGVGIDSSFEDEYTKHLNDAHQIAKVELGQYDTRKSRPGSYKRNRRMRKRNLTKKL